MTGTLGRMASTEVNKVALGSSGSPDIAFEDLSGLLRGWKRKLSTRKTGAPKRKDVSYIAPNGEEIKSSLHLSKHLKAHPGVLRPGDFCWTSVEGPRRSLRLNRKGRHIRFEELDLFPTKRRKSNNHENVKENTTSPVKSNRGRKPGGISKMLTVTAKEKLMLAVKAEPVVETSILDASKDPRHEVGCSDCLNNVDDEQEMEKSFEIMINPKLDSEEVLAAEGATLSIEVHQTMDIDFAVDSNHVEAINVEEAPGDILAAEVEETVGVGAPIMTDDTKEEVDIVFKETLDNTEVDVATDKSNLVERDTDVRLAGPEGNLICTTVVVEQKEEVDPDLVDEPNPEDQMVEEILSFISEEPLEEEKVHGIDVSDGLVEDKTMKATEEEINSKEIELWQSQGIHALVDDTIAFGSKALPEDEEFSQAMHEVSQAVHGAIPVFI